METMEKGLKSRNTIRKSFTKTVNNINALLKNGTNDLCEIKSLMELLEKRYNEISKLDGILHDLMLDSNFSEHDLDNETHSVDEYTVTFNRVRAVVLKLDKDSISCNSSVSLNKNTDDIKQQLQLLLPELKTFGGDLLEWLPFWSQFKIIDKDPTINPDIKFQYLIKAIKPFSEASDLLKNIPTTGDNYSIAISDLKARFGREDILIELYVKELLSLVLQNAQKSEIVTFSVLYDKLDYNLEALNSLNMTEQCSSILLPLVELCLPEEILKVWQMNDVATTYESVNTSKYRLQQLMKLLKAEGKVQKLAVVSSNNDKKEISTNLKISGSNEATTLLTSTNDLLSCKFCGGKHKTSKCTKGKEIKLQEVNTEIDINKSFNGESEADIIYLKSLDPKKWKEQDHYRVLGLSKLRSKATEEQIKNAYSIKVLNHFPDKRRKLGEKVQVDDDYFTCIMKAWEILGNKTKRREYDSSDSKFDNSIPSDEIIKKSDFFKLFGPIFHYNGKLSKECVMPLLGDLNSSKDYIDNFYKSWYNFNTWRECSFLNKEQCEDSNIKEHQLIDNQCANQKKEEKIYIKKLVDLAYANDPRILKLKEDDKVGKAAPKQIKQKQEKIKVQKEVAVGITKQNELKAEQDGPEGKAALKQAKKDAKQKQEKIKVQKEVAVEKTKQIELKAEKNGHEGKAALKQTKKDTTLKQEKIKVQKEETKETGLKAEKDHQETKTASKPTKQKQEKIKVQKEETKETELKKEKDHQEVKTAPKPTKQKQEKVKIVNEKEETVEKAKQIMLKIKENEKKELQKKRTYIRDLCKTNNYYLQNGDNVFEVMSGVEKLCDQLSAKQLKQLANALEKEGHKALVDSIKLMEA